MAKKKIRHFMAITECVKHSKTYGWDKVTDRIYEIVDNVPHVLFDSRDGNVLLVTFNTSATRGETSEIMNALAKNGYIDESFAGKYYLDSETEQNGFLIHCFRGSF